MFSGDECCCSSANADVIYRSNVLRSSLRPYVTALSTDPDAESRILRRAPTYAIQAVTNTKEVRICWTSLAAVSLLFQWSLGRKMELDKYRQQILKNLYLQRMLLFDEYDSLVSPMRMRLI